MSGLPTDGGPVSSDNSGKELGGLQEQIDDVGRGLLRRIDPGTRAMAVAVAVFVLVITALLPWIGGVPGWQVLVGQADNVRIDVLPRVFSFGVYVFGVLGSAIALGTRRWWVAWLCTLGSGVFTVLGVVSIWSQQSSPSHQPGPGPGPGLILALLTMLVLVITWARIVWSRPGGLFNRPPD